MQQYDAFDPAVRQAMRPIRWRTGDVVAVRGDCVDLVYRWVQSSILYWVTAQPALAPQMHIWYRTAGLAGKQARSMQRQILRQKIKHPFIAPACHPHRGYRSWFGGDTVIKPAASLQAAASKEFGRNFSGGVLAIDARIINAKDAQELRQFAAAHQLLLLLMIDKEPQHWPQWVEGTSATRTPGEIPELMAPVHSTVTLTTPPREVLQFDYPVKCNVQGEGINYSINFSGTTLLYTARHDTLSALPYQPLVTSNHQPPIRSLRQQLLAPRQPE